ncbi:MAG: hypothetical protein FJW30_28440 [Acidobacteria bacterium]|nr:hypothetical protein [Acidobacteriota bacterium]
MFRLAVLFFCVLPVNAAESDALAISANIQSRHVPFGTVMDPFYASADSERITGYTRCGDSAIWTGHYLAAEAFRFAVTADPDAQANAARAVEAIDALLTVTGTGLLARCRIPLSSPFAEGIHSEERANGVFTNAANGATWIGNTSRDQYLGVTFGMAVAHEHLPLLRPRISGIVTRMVDFLVASNWSPRGGSTFLLRPDQMLGILQVARRVNPARFDSIYKAQRERSAKDVATPVAFDSLSTSSYFKFNLIHITFLHLVQMEEPESRGVYERAFSIARNYTAGHQNPFFNMIDHTLHGPEARRDAETVALLDLWLKRPRRDFYADRSGTVRVCGEQACDPVPVDLRTPTDFLWQRNPFQLKGGGSGTIGNAGVDYILPYWMARFHGVIPSIGVQREVAPDSLVSLYGAGLGTAVTVNGLAARTTFASPRQVNVHLPASLSMGPGVIQVNGTKRDTAIVQITETAPFVYTMNANGLAAATAVDAQNQPVRVFVCSPDCQPAPIAAAGPVFLTLYATGLRRAIDVRVTAGGTPVTVLYSGPQPEFPGLDQINVELPRGLRGRVEIRVTAGGRAANDTHIEFSNF